MSHMTDPIADLFTRLRNAQGQRHRTVVVPASKLKKAVLNVLKAEGYIADVIESTSAAGHPQLEVELKYYQGQPVINTLTRVSKPGQRIYSQSKEIPMVANGLGVTIVSTSHGVMSDTKARELNIGGEILGQVF